VTVLDLSEKILPREDPDAAKLVEASLLSDGTNIVCGVKGMKFSSVEGVEWPIITASYETSDGPTSLDCEALLVATGRQPNVNGVGLEAAGIDFDQRFGIPVSDHMVTSNPDVYAIGDCSSKWQFTHMAGNQAMMVVENAIFGGDRKVSELVIPRCTYTSPEVAGTGASEPELIEQGVEYEVKHALHLPLQSYISLSPSPRLSPSLSLFDYQVYKAGLEHNDRAILESSNTGFCKMLVKKGTPEILGATIVAENAGDIISEMTLAIQNKVGLDQIGFTIHPYPTIAECIGGCAHQYKVKNWKTLPSS